MALKDKIRVRRDTTANFTSANPVLSLGEISFDTTTKQFKVGDGASTWTSLPYSDAAAIAAYAQPLNAAVRFVKGTWHTSNETVPKQRFAFDEGGTTYIQGHASIPITIRNGAGSDLLQFSDEGLATFNGAGGSVVIRPFGGATSVTGSNLHLRSVYEDITFVTNVGTSDNTPLVLRDNDAIFGGGATFNGNVSATSLAATNLGTTTNLPLLTGSSGTITTGSFGTTANTFCQGNDSRVVNAAQLNAASQTFTGSAAFNGNILGSGSVTGGSFSTGGGITLSGSGADSGIVLKDRDAASVSLAYSTAGALRIFRSTVASDVASFADALAWFRGGIEANGSVSVGPITKSALLALTPSATAGEYRITDSTPAQRRAYPDGSNWRYSDDSTIVT
jgi:hypothetical protein